MALDVLQVPTVPTACETAVGCRWGGSFALGTLAHERVLVELGKMRSRQESESNCKNNGGDEMMTSRQREGSFLLGSDRGPKRAALPCVPAL